MKGHREEVEKMRRWEDGKQWNSELGRRKIT
jgi:hypothetical protein